MMERYKTYKIMIPGPPGSKQSTRFRKEKCVDAQGKPDIKIRTFADPKIVALEKKYWQYAATELRKQKYKLVGRALIHVTKLWYVFPIFMSTPDTWSPQEKEFYNNNSWLWMHGKPDLSDNLQKPLFDSLTNLVYQNDCHAVALDGLRKMWGPKECVGIVMEFHVCGDVPDDNFLIPGAKNE
jgi:Holliday junction resolvase RusA-like endonuclease